MQDYKNFGRSRQYNLDFETAVGAVSNFMKKIGEILKFLRAVGLPRETAHDLKLFFSSFLSICLSVGLSLHFLSFFYLITIL